VKDWTFNNQTIAENFDSHVREQLPWYELVTESVAYIARSYLPYGGHVYDIGSSTGNMAKALLPLLDERRATMSCIESSQEMCEAFKHSGIDSTRIKLYNTDARAFDFAENDVSILFLTAMFLPVKQQYDFVSNIYDSINDGGALIIVDKVCDDEGYFATVMKRLTMYWKLKNGAEAEQIMAKELSLSGVQRPISDAILPFGAKQFFQLGESKGWVIEK
jgi:tRNA (cmo5U34)-methyltransferase